MKGSPADPAVSLGLADFGLDIEEYKSSLNPHHGHKLIIDGKMINQSFLYSSLLQKQIKNDEWFKDHLEIDEKYICETNKLLQTTSNYRKLPIYSK
jgi:hypothetical protein